MPIILRLNGYRFFFYSLENQEPAHVHIERAECVAKFWLTPVKLASNYKFRSHELSKLKKIVEENSHLFLEKWNEHFSTEIKSPCN